MSRVRRNRRSPRPATEGDFLHTPRCTPTPSPPTSPEPHPQRSEPDDRALEIGGGHPGHVDHRRRQRLAASLRDARRTGSKEDARQDEERGREKEDPETSEDRGSSGTTREFSLIEHYPPRERVTLNGSSGGGSDSGSGTTPPPTRPAPPALIDARVPSRLSRLDSPLHVHAAPKRQNTVAATDLRTFSSLSKLDSASSPKPTRSAITP